jgi:hypothetical protein
VIVFLAVHESAVGTSRRLRMSDVMSVPRGKAEMICSTRCRISLLHDSVDHLLDDSFLVACVGADAELPLLRLCEQVTPARKRSVNPKPTRAAWRTMALTPEIARIGPDCRRSGMRTFAT